MLFRSKVPHQDLSAGEQFSSLRMPDPKRLKKVPGPYSLGAIGTIATGRDPIKDPSGLSQGGAGAFSVCVSGRVVRAWTTCVSLAGCCVRHPVTDESRLSLFLLGGLLLWLSALPAVSHGAPGRQTSAATARMPHPITLGASRASQNTVVQGYGGCVRRPVNVASLVDALYDALALLSSFSAADAPVCAFKHGGGVCRHSVGLLCDALRLA